MRMIKIEWHRLVDEKGVPCSRCESTEKAVDSAHLRLRCSLEPLGIETRIEKHELDENSFRENPRQSNRISIEGKTVEQWLNGNTGQTPCSGPCGDSDCRTIEIDGCIYEEIPEELIIRAGLLAAAEKIREIPAQESCC